MAGHATTIPSFIFPVLKEIPFAAGGSGGQTSGVSARSCAERPSAAAGQRFATRWMSGSTPQIPGEATVPGSVVWGSSLPGSYPCLDRPAHPVDRRWRRFRPQGSPRRHRSHTVSCGRFSPGGDSRRRGGRARRCCRSLTTAQACQLAPSPHAPGRDGQFEHAGVVGYGSGAIRPRSEGRLVR